jgi:6-pyruvoyltetrahydropterin/6-carboxytetrahydropterin synthase
VSTQAAPVIVRIVRTASFSSAHRYFDQSLSATENREAFGSWYREKGFGHNFRIEAHFEGEVSALTGMIVNLVHVDRWLNAVTEQLDHRHLNELEIFAGKAPTPERIASFCFSELVSQMKLTPASGESGNATLVKVRLYEGESLWVDCLTSNRSVSAPESS